MAKFFKSTAFKCTIVLVCLMIVFGGGLAILNSLWSVSPEERTMRALQKIYDTNAEIKYETIYEEDSAKEEDKKDKQFDGVGKINKIYQVGDDLIFQSTGEKGYNNGTITVWVQVKTTIVSGQNQYTIEKVVLEGYEKQTLMSQLKSSYYEKFNGAIEGDKTFTTEAGSGRHTNPISGATKSATAGNNAVNCVIKYLGGK
ncbi:MAG: hypothetical protein IJC07_04260 [Clostridia bacterium]|nr:hypothetical protein [Clostridia bacterium]